ncbi:putative bifunctional diguanylate cyclase/phosphodiesterase [Leptolyngbya sp. PCC 6406]|uniref:putative bifunctional diguanylate cyclase/phosphodiesterase n=1 Tax=Leptolyngbya sp. PCC 6406 TaxID=1173264 RepID=UPI0002AC680D|nr:GGDEF domain-containing response regulator [Leptolyngbya sp. PCC 6406]
MDPYASNYLEAPHPADILIVDDTLENVVFLADVLESQGYLVRKALSGEMALRAVDTAIPDLILLDICMPDLDGYEVCRRIKAQVQAAQVPVIFLSALSEAGDKVQAFDVGGVDYITKPFQAAEVLARTRNHLLLRSALQVVQDLNHQLEAKVRQRTQQLELANAQLMELAYHDDLTKLPNRALLMECLARSLESMQTDPDYQFALLFLDCDRFKLVNDSFGHAAGDELLMEIAQRLSSCLGPNDTLARFGGDEFVVLLNQVSGQRAANAIAQSLLDVLTPSFHLAQGEIFISASVGVVLSNAAQHYRPEHMLRDADTAMYCAKANGKARFCLFNPAMQRASAEILQIETELHQALNRQELLPYYQPIVYLENQQTVGMEVLCRWCHPERGLLLPHTFIPVAEETQLIVDLGNYLLDAACTQLSQWQQLGVVNDSFYLSLNISTRHLSQINLPTQLGQCLARHHLKSHHLRLEITESGVLDNEIASKVMKQLEFQKIRLSVDDFGTGYSSLSYLHRLPVSTLKIDRAFVQDISKNTRDASVVTAILGIAKALRLEVVAEGIETPSQLEQLQSMGCDFGQGYLFARPMSAPTAEAFLSPQKLCESTG